LGFPEFTRYLSDPNTALASAILRQYPTAQAFRTLSPKRLAKLTYDGRHRVGEELARKLIDAARISVGSQHSQAHQTGVRYACEDLQTLRDRLKQLEAEISGKLEQHQVGKLLTTIAGIGDSTAAMLIAELGDPARFLSAGALAAYLGLCPGHKHSGKHQPKSSALAPLGNRRVRQALWMPTLGAATQSNPWLMAFYRRLMERGKPHKVALIAAMRKLVGAVYSVAKHRRPFVPFLNTQPAPRLDYEKA
jgi:transposase